MVATYSNKSWWANWLVQGHMDKTANMSEGKERYLAEIDHVLHQTSIHNGQG
jgi:hypothetical protein